MLVAPTLVLVWELAVCETYDYEYAQGNGDNSYYTYNEEQVTFRSGPDAGRVRRFGEDIRQLITTDSYDVSGAIMQILGDRRRDTFTNITTSSSSYVPEYSIFTPLSEDQYINDIFPTRPLTPYITPYVEDVVPTRSSTPLLTTEVDTQDYTTEIAVVKTKTLLPVIKPLLDERGLQTILELSDENTIPTHKILEATEGGEESTTHMYQITVENDVTQYIKHDITTGTEVTDVTEGNTRFLNDITEEKGDTEDTLALGTKEVNVAKEITTLTHQIPEVTEFGEEENAYVTLTEYLTTSLSNTVVLATAQTFTKMTTYGHLRVPPQKTSWLTVITPTSTKIKVKELNEASWLTGTLSNIYKGNIADGLLRQSNDNEDTTISYSSMATTNTDTNTNPNTTKKSKKKKKKKKKTKKKPKTIETTPQTTRITTTRVNFDIEKFLEIIANLTYDYETNLTARVNETLHRMSAPTCRQPTLPTTETAPPEYSALNKTIIAKCFVCGLETPGIPYDADCADAFAGDFLPLVPQDPRAKGKIARFRKYCRYGEIHNYFYNASQPRSLFGRWTGGCSVRWTDLTGIYTQRSCRNRKRPTTGLHYASKRMAKLEAALSLVEQGCIVSPVATLLPLSRGISLFARFHACVCLGNWCNAAHSHGPSLEALVTALTLAMALRQFDDGPYRRDLKIL